MRHANRALLVAALAALAASACDEGESPVTPEKTGAITVEFRRVDTLYVHTRDTVNAGIVDTVYMVDTVTITLPGRVRVDTVHVTVPPLCVLDARKVAELPASAFYHPYDLQRLCK